MNPVETNQGTAQVPYPHKQARQSRKDQPWRRLATVNKIAQVKGWNLPNYREKRTIAELLEQLGEYAYLTGKHLGTYYLSTLDLDIQREEFPINRINRLLKNAARLLNYLQVSHNLTKKGFHVDILTPEPLENGTIYWTDKLGKKWNVGSIQSKGKYIVGEGPNKTPIESRKWYWKALTNEEVKTTLNKFFFNFQAAVPVVAKPVEISKTPLPSLFSDSKKPKPTIKAQILSKQKVPLPHLWKVFYLDCQSKQTRYFLWNDYHRKKVDLRLGNTYRIGLVKEQKHYFFNHLIQS